MVQTQQHEPLLSLQCFVRQVFGRAEEKGIKIDVTERFKDRLVDEGYNPAYGARPLRRAIMRLLEDSMAERMLSGDIKARPWLMHMAWKHHDRCSPGLTRPSQRLIWLR